MIEFLKIEQKQEGGGAVCYRSGRSFPPLPTFTNTTPIEHAVCACQTEGSNISLGHERPRRTT